MFKSTLPDDTEPSAEARQIADELLPKGFFADVRDLMSYRGMQDDCEDKLRRDFMFALDRFRAVGVREFAVAILHGDDVHRQWLVDAANAFVAKKPLPTPRSAKGPIA